MTGDCGDILDKTIQIKPDCDGWIKWINNGCDVELHSNEKLVIDKHYDEIVNYLKEKYPEEFI